MACWRGRGPFENMRAGNRCWRGGTATTDRSIRTDVRDGGVAETAQFAGTTKGPKQGAKGIVLPAGKGRCVDGICRGDGVLVGLKSLETTVAHSAEYLR